MATGKHPISIRLDEKQVDALSWLRKQMGGFNLQQAVNHMIIEVAKQKGWKEGESAEE